MNRKILVTGGAGFIGSHLVDGLIDMNCQVTIIDDLSTGKKENINPSAYHWLQDLTKIDVKTLANSMISFGIDVVYHMAAKTAVQESMLEPELYDSVNVGVTLKLLEACNIAGVKRFVFSSTSAVYGNAETIPTNEHEPTQPLSHYAASKLNAEEYCRLYEQLYDFDIRILRYFNVYGDRMSDEGGYKLVFPIFKELKEQGGKLTINNDGEQRRDFVHVQDVVNINILVGLGNLEYAFELFNVGTGVNYSVNEIADMFGGEKIYNNNVKEPYETLADMSRVNEKLDYKPKDRLKEWIKDYVN